MLQSESVDVVITDIMLPGMDGLELTDRIRKNFEVDVIVMTGYSGDYSYEEAISKGASDFVFKPVRFEELLLRLRRVLKERRLTQERIQMLEKLKRLSITDGLTKLGLGSSAVMVAGNFWRAAIFLLDIETESQYQYRHVRRLPSAATRPKAGGSGMGPALAAGPAHRHGARRK